MGALPNHRRAVAIRLLFELDRSIGRSKSPLTFGEGEIAKALSDSGFKSRNSYHSSLKAIQVAHGLICGRVAARDRVSCVGSFHG